MQLAANTLWLIAAMLAQGALALGLLWYLGFVRVPMILNGKVNVRDIATDRGGWPEHERKVSNAFDNQFQLPLLFYVGSLVAIGFGATLIEVALAFAFVLSRFVHAFIHVTSNHVIRRFYAYTAGLVLLCLLWLDLAIRLVLIALGGN